MKMLNVCMALAAATAVMVFGAEKATAQSAVEGELAVLKETVRKLERETDAMRRCSSRGIFYVPGLAGTDGDGCISIPDLMTRYSQERNGKGIDLAKCEPATYDRGKMYRDNGQQARRGNYRFGNLAVERSHGEIIAYSQSKRIGGGGDTSESCHIVQCLDGQYYLKHIIPNVQCGTLAGGGKAPMQFAN